MFESQTPPPVASRIVAFVSWLLPVAATIAAVVFVLIARGDWLDSTSALARCSQVAEVAGMPALGLALFPILLGGFGLGFFTFAGRELDGRARVAGLFVCLLALAAWPRVSSPSRSGRETTLVIALAPPCRPRRPVGYRVLER